MMPPANLSISELSKQTHIPVATLYSWRKQAKEKGLLAPRDNHNPEQWSAQDKFTVVVETASMNDSERSAYCRRRGLYVEQIESWKVGCISGNESTLKQARTLKDETKADKQRIKSLERDLRHKEKALAETAALLVLRKKAAAIWGEDEDA